MSIINNAKELADLIKKLDDVELYRKIVELEGEIIDLTRENRELDSKVEELEKKLQLQSALHFKEPFYYQDNDGVPFCPKCWESDQKAVHLFNNGYFGDWDFTEFICNNCKSEYRYQGRHT